MEICLHGQRRSLDRLGMRFLGLGFEALKLDFLDDGRDIGEINLLDGGFDNGIGTRQAKAAETIVTAEGNTTLTGADGFTPLEDLGLVTSTDASQGAHRLESLLVNSQTPTS
jgi:hypothetical protein